MACGGFDFVKRGRYTGKERKAVIATEHAGKRAEIVGLEFVENGAALGDTNNPPVENIGDPDGSICIQANAVGRHVRLLKDLAHIRCCRRLTEGSPGAALAQRAMGDGESGQTVGQRQRNVSELNFFAAVQYPALRCAHC